VYRQLAKTLTLAAVAAILVLTQVAAPQTASAQTPTITLSLPGQYVDFVTDDTLAAFEAQYGVNVHIVAESGGMIAINMGGGGNADITAQLEAAQELASTADVVYVDQASMTPIETQAGYFLNLAPLANSDPALNINDFYPAVWQSFQWDQGLWALPIAADAIMVTYDPIRFDAAGVAYPHDGWTIDDFANAARTLTTYNADGTVLTPGISATSPGSTLPYLVRALTGTGFYDDTVVPNTPTFSDPNLTYILDTLRDLLDEGVITTGFMRQTDEGEASPMGIQGAFGFAGRFGDQDALETLQAVPLPGGSMALSASGFAVSSGTQYPELAYALAAYMTTLPELTSGNFLSATTARQSLSGAADTATANNGNNNEGAGGGPGGGRNSGIASLIPDQIQAVIDSAIWNALPGAEMRYGDYITATLNEMSSSGIDAQAALQTQEANAISAVQSAVDASADTNVIVAAAPEEAVLAPGEIALNCAYNSGFTMRGGGGGQIPNEENWNTIIDAFVASDPEVGAVNIIAEGSSDLEELAANYDCFILPSNGVQGSDVSPLLNLDPLLDTDPGFDRNDMLTGILPQVQQNNMTWALPLTIQPQAMSYNPDMLALAGVPEPVNGWTTDTFIDALNQLVPYMDEETAPFSPNDPSGAYLLQLIGAFGGLPIDYRTDPVTLNFTDPATINAIQQVLDLAKNDLMTYESTGMGGGRGFAIGGDSTTAITTNVISQITRQAGFRPGSEQTTMISTLYPQGSQGGFVAFDITTAYISSTTQSPEASYRFLSAVAEHPELFGGMPVHQSQINDPAVMATQDANTTALFAQLDTLLQNPNTVVFPANSGIGGLSTNFITEYWLRAAFDAYINEDADLQLELETAQITTQAYLECIETTAESDLADANSTDEMMNSFMVMAECAQTVDPNIQLMGGN
jgi:ABC-type glycerol-3-phosphate transport system substrate-binding protein